MIPHNAAHALVENMWPVGSAPGHRPDKTPSAGSLRRIPVMTTHQKHKFLSDDGRKQLVLEARRLPSAGIARRPRPVIPSSVDASFSIHECNGRRESQSGRRIGRKGDR